jgi:predicted permease
MKFGGTSVADAEAIRRVAALPGVVTAAAVSALPMYPVGIDFSLPFTVDGKTPATATEEPRADIRIATPRYFETMKIPLRQGRVIDERDGQGAPPATVINETMARRYFGGRDPLGRVAKNPHGSAEVVGIVGDVKHYGLDSEPRAELFMPAWQQPLNGMALVVRTAADPKLFVDSIRREILTIDAEQPIFDASAMVDVVARSVFLPRVSMLLLSAFALSALLLAVVGIYGVVSYAVAQRTREIGVRIALGARPDDVLRLVVRQGMTPVAVGLALGLAGAFAATRLLRGLLYGVGTSDPVTFAAITMILGAVALAASVFPARRAARVDPMVALRAE